jgi:hypothetical protein
MLYLFWALLLILQNASFTLVSRARNSGSDWYHAFAAVGSNGIWLIAFYLTYDKVFLKIGEQGILHALPAALTYVVCTVTGSVFMGKFSRRFLEKGKRQVGHYDANKARLDRLEADIEIIKYGGRAQITEGKNNASSRIA